MNSNSLSSKRRSSKSLAIAPHMSECFSLTPRFNEVTQHGENENNCFNSFNFVSANVSAQSRHPWKDHARTNPESLAQTGIANHGARTFLSAAMSRAHTGIKPLLKPTVAQRCCGQQCPRSAARLELRTLGTSSRVVAKNSDTNAFRHLSFGATRRYKSSRDKAVGGPKQPTGKNRMCAPNKGTSGGRDAAKNKAPQGVTHGRSQYGHQH